jgi:hypothetical protein
MRALLIALCLMTAAHAQQQAPARDSAGVPRRATAILEGMVTTPDATPRPIRRARVSLAGSDGRAGVTTTDDEGRFTFEGLAPGRYTLSVTKPGYIRAAFGARRVDGPGTPITLSAGQRLTGVTIALSRGAVITGTIVDHTGLPAPGVQVRAMQYRLLAGGGRALSRAPGALTVEQTDDRGVYRLYGLPAGEYVVVATPRVPPGGEIRAMTEREILEALAVLQQPPSALQPGTSRAAANDAARRADPDAVTVGYAPIYFPGTTSASNATTVTVAAGEERGDVSFALQLVRTTRVEGTLAVPAGITPQQVQLFLLQADGASAETLTPGPGRAVIEADGRFSFSNVAPGQYTLHARAGSGPMVMQMAADGDSMRFLSRVTPAANGPDIAAHWGMTEVLVDGQPVTNIGIAMQPALTSMGRMTADASTTGRTFDAAQVRVSLTPITTGGPAFHPAPNFLPGPAGAFTLTGVLPGRYRLSLGGPGEVSGGWQLKSATFGGRDVLDLPVEIAPESATGPFVLTFTDRTQQVSGSLHDQAGRPATDYAILVFADDERYWAAGSRRIRTARPATDGQFNIDGLPAGDYRIAALTDITPAESSDPAFLRAVRDASMPFTLNEGERRVQDFRLGR